MRCQRCAAEAPTWLTTFYRNIGIVVVHFRQTATMQLCRRCLHKEYWKRFAILVTVGWTSYYSLVIGPVLLVVNTVNYVRAIASPPTALPDSDGPTALPGG
jgi:hypothetical protein